jgi:hypothetical protein
MTLSKGDGAREMLWPGRHVANPGRNALCGKKPEAKTRIAEIVKMLARKYEVFWMRVYIINASGGVSPRSQGL